MVRRRNERFLRTAGRGIASRGIVLAACLAIGIGDPAASQPLAIIDTVCDVDLATCTDGIQGLRGARSVALSPDGAHLYVAVSLDDALQVMARSLVSGELTPLQSLFDTDPGIDGLDSARGVVVSPDGEHVYVAALLDASLTAFDRNPVTGLVTFVEIERDGVGGVNGLAGAHAVAVSPDGRHVYVAGRSDDALAIFERNPVTGALTFLEAEFDNTGGVDGLDAAEAVAVSPDGAHVYVTGETDNAVAVFVRETDPGALDFGEVTFVEAQIDGLGGVDGLEGAGSVAVSPDGANVYVASERGSLGGIAGGDWLAVFGRNPGTGALTFVQDLQEIDFDIFAGCTGVGNENSGVAIAPDGSAVFLTNPFFGTVAAFDRSPGTGMLTLADAICDLSFGADGLAGAVGITASPDGNHLYTAASAFETVAALAIDAVFLDGFESGDTNAWSQTIP